MYKHGGDIYTNKNVIDFSANLNPLGMPSFVAEAAKNAINISDVYPDMFQRELIEEIAKREDVNKKNIICTNGAAELIFGICFALRPQKAVLVCPSFEEYRQALEASGVSKIQNYFLKEEKGFVLEENFLSELKYDTDIVFLCNPNNPTGRLIDETLLSKIIEECKKKNILLVIDECFLDFLEENLSQKSEVFVIKAFTKMYSMAGIRLGYGIYKDEKFLNKIRSVIQPWNVSVVAQKSGVEAAKDTKFLEETKKFIKKEKDFLLKEIEPYIEKIYGHEANYIFFKGEKSLDHKLLLKGIMIRDCSSFKGLEKGYFRIAVKDREDNLSLIKALQEVKNG